MVPSSQDTTPADVVVIGGGPAGSATSTLAAQHGLRVVLFERERFPRFHIGESLIPETYWPLKRLNMLEKMKSSRSVKKYSVQFVSASGELSAPFYFWDNEPHECSQTWQVVRSEFDKMLLDNARVHGVDVHERTRVLEVLFDGDRAVGVKVRGADGRDREVRAAVVVDASGQQAMLQNRLKLRIWDPVLNKQHDHGSADRRSVHRRARHRMGPDGIPVPTGEGAHPDVARGPRSAGRAGQGERAVSAGRPAALSAEPRELLLDRPFHREFSEFRETGIAP